MRPVLIRCAILVAATVLGMPSCGGDDVADQLLAARSDEAVSAVTAAVIPQAPAISASQVSPKSAKRGVAYDLADAADFAALSPGVSWWYNWSPQPSAAMPANPHARYQMDFYPMIRGISYDVSAVESYLHAHRQIKYLLVLNEPNLTSQADLTPQQAASLWPDFEAIAKATGVKLVGPAVTWGTMPGYRDPVAWLDAFYAAYEAASGGRPPQIDYIAFHWYDYGLGQQLDRLRKYGKPFWVTEIANWHAQRDGGQIDTVAKQEAQMADMVATCESRADVFRYAWYTGRRADDPHHSSLLGARGELTQLGRLYLRLPFAGSGEPPASSAQQAASPAEGPGRASGGMLPVTAVAGGQGPRRVRTQPGEG